MKAPGPGYRCHHLLRGTAYGCRPVGEPLRSRAGAGRDPLAHGGEIAGGGGVESACPGCSGLRSRSRRLHGPAGGSGRDPGACLWRGSPGGAGVEPGSCPGCGRPCPPWGREHILACLDARSCGRSIGLPTASGGFPGTTCARMPISPGEFNPPRWPLVRRWLPAGVSPEALKARVPGLQGVDATLTAAAGISPGSRITPSGRVLSCLQSRPYRFICGITWLRRKL